MTKENLQSKDLIEELNDLHDLQSELTESETLNDEDYQRMKALETLVSDCEGYVSDWAYGVELIHEDNFQDHIEEIIDECYELPKSSAWPYRHLTLDLEAAADEARQDYIEVDLDGETYLVR